MPYVYHQTCAKSKHLVSNAASTRTLQGTIADIMNKGILRLLELEKQGELRYLLSVYDCCYVATSFENRDVVERVMIEEANKIQISIGVKAKVHGK